MIVKLTKTLSVVLLVAALRNCAACGVPGFLVAAAPFSCDDSAQAKAAKPVLRSPQQPPSTWDKVTTGTKNFFSKTGETLGLKKPEKKPIPQYAYPKPPVLQKNQTREEVVVRLLVQAQGTRKTKDRPRLVGLQ